MTNESLIDWIDSWKNENEIKNPSIAWNDNIIIQNYRIIIQNYRIIIQNYELKLQFKIIIWNDTLKS